MAKVYAPFPMTRTMGDLTFYMMGGVNYVRTKSRLTRQRVLKSPNSRKTRFYAELMSQASRIGSVIYQSLPHHWRQGWMFRAFTGEALQLLKEGKSVEETTRLLWERYVEAINHHRGDPGARLQAAVDSAAVTPRGTRKKKDPRVERLKKYSDLLVEASKIASELYKSLPVEKRKIPIYRAFVAEVMRILHDHEGSGTQCPVTATDTDAVGQSLSAAEKGLGQVSGDVEAMIPITQGSVKNSKKLVNSSWEAGLFYIPRVDATSPKRFSRRRKHPFLLQ